MLVVPDPATAFLDPFSEVPTLVMICTIRDPVTGESYSRDARHIAQKTEAFLKGTGVGDTAYFFSGNAGCGGEKPSTAIYTFRLP